MGTRSLLRAAGLCTHNTDNQSVKTGSGVDLGSHQKDCWHFLLVVRTGELTSVHWPSIPFSAGIYII